MYVYESRVRTLAIRGARRHARTHVGKTKAGYCCITIVRVGNRSEEGRGDEEGRALTGGELGESPMDG